MQARVQGQVQAQGLNLVQMSPNWFLGIWALELPLKWALVVLGTPFVVTRSRNSRAQ
jgi:hypothetical protein